MKPFKTGVHRVTPNSEAGRRMITIAQPKNPTPLTKEQRDWNAAVDAKKAAKKVSK
jgi:hypothetical protein